MVRGVMRALLGLPIVVVLGCSNACPAPVVCSEPHLDYCPCLVVVVDTGPRPDAFVPPVDASVEDDADLDAASESDADVDADMSDANTSDANTSDANTSDAGNDSAVDGG